MLRAKIEHYQAVAKFAGSRVSDYLDLVMLEVGIFRAALIRTVMAGVAAIVCALFAASFLSVAVLVTFWESDSRTMVAWCVFGVWLVLAIVAGLVAKSGAPDTHSFAELPEQFKADLSAIRNDRE